MMRADVRSGQSWSLRQGLKNRLIRGLIRAAISAVDRVPARRLPGLGAALGSVVHLLSGRLRRHARQQVRLALPEADCSKVVSRCYRAAGENLARCLLLRRPEVRAMDLVIVPPEARCALDGALAEGRGCVVMSAHFGPFEYIAAALVELGYSASVVVRESYDPKLDGLVDAHRRSRGLNVIHRGASNAALAIVRALRRGHIVGMLPDLPGRVATVPIRLLAGVADFALGPERIARRAGAPLLAVWLEPLGQAPRPLALRRPAFRLRVERIRSGPGEYRATQQMADCVAEAVRCSPYHCLWMGMNFQMFSPKVERTLTSLRT